MRAPRNVKTRSTWRRRAAHARDLVVVAYDETRVGVLRALSPRRRRRDRFRHSVLLGVLADNATPDAEAALYERIFCVPAQGADAPRHGPLPDQTPAPGRAETPPRGRGAGSTHPLTLERQLAVTTNESDFSSLRGVLADAVESAGVTGAVNRRRDDEGDFLELRLIGSRRLPFALTTEAAAAWLEAAGIDATVDYRDVYLVISLRDERTVDRLVERLLRPFMYAESVCERLGDALAPHRLHPQLSLPDSGSLVLALRDSEALGAAVRLGALLGAGDIGEGLKLHRPGGMRKLAARMRLLLTGALGRGVRVLAEPGCAHEQDELSIHLTVEQGLRLAGRIAAESVRAEQEEAPFPVEETRIPPIWISSDP
ncbi:hypothetical protein ACFRKD_00625 [Streptomyces niveus]|uniref:hypothetical protein n=1 Tax=Streptomyces niveus TaxID=193462 RepID=UPI003675BF10